MRPECRNLGLDRLSDLLGDDHDLAVLRPELALVSAPIAADPDALAS